MKRFNRIRQKIGVDDQALKQAFDAIQRLKPQTRGRYHHRPAELHHARLRSPYGG